MREPAPARLFVAVAGRIDAPLEEFGTVALAGEPYDLSGFTDYYAREMGSPLRKRLVAFARPFDPGRLVEMKRLAMRLEGPSPRSVNLDPGYVTPAKVVLASAKDFAHRVYLGEGIYAEVTLVYRREEAGYIPLEHTFPDYRSTDVRYFFNRLRGLL